jgi:phosphatidylglycerophosphate synthase
METNIPNIVGLFIALLGTIFLAFFGIRFSGDRPIVRTGGHWTNEQWQRLGFILLGVGFILQLGAQIAQLLK